MSTQVQIESELGSHQGGLSECKPLLQAATRELFRKNVFRITGLPVDATAREIARHSDKLKMQAELGQDLHTQSAVFSMKPPPRLDDIREAIQRLKDPETRIIHELFWFWPEEFGNGQYDPAIQALAKGDVNSAIDIWSAKEKSVTGGLIAAHNLALVYHVTVLDWENYAVKNDLEAERRQKVTNYWKGAFTRWARLTTSEPFWDIVAARIRQLNEPNLPRGFARLLRRTLPEALIKINAELAIAYAEAGKIELARLHVQFMRQANITQDTADKLAGLVLAPVRNRLNEQIRRGNECAEQAPQNAASAARELLDQTEHVLALFDLFFGKDSVVRKDLFDDVAERCNQLQIAYHKVSGDNQTCLELLKAILPFVTSVEVRRLLEKNIDTLRGNLAAADSDPIYALLNKVQESKQSPSVKLRTVQTEVLPLVSEFVSRLRGEPIPPQLGRNSSI